jgi:hypothetical protein
MISGPSHEEFLASASTGEAKVKNRTEWDFELRCELNMLADLDYAIRGHIIQEALKVEDKNGWKHFDEYLLARLAEVRRAELHRLQVRDPCKCVFYSVHRIMLWTGLMSVTRTCVMEWEEGNGPGYRVGVVANLQR